MGRPPRGPVKVDKLGRPLNFGNYVNGRLVVTGSKKKGGGKGKGGSKGGRGGRGGSSGGGRGVGGGGRGGGSSGSSGGSGGSGGSGSGGRGGGGCSRGGGSGGGSGRGGGGSGSGHGGGSGSSSRGAAGPTAAKLPRAASGPDISSVGMASDAESALRRALSSTALDEAATDALSPGTPVLALYPEDGEWYAATVVSLSENTVEVFYDDWDEFGVVEYDSVALPEEEEEEEEEEAPAPAHLRAARSAPRSSPRAEFVPPPPHANPHRAQREALPAFGHRAELLRAIAAHQVVVIEGSTGCGKTTQVPQFVLEEAAAEGRPCSVLCTQPRRISAMSVAERVAAERGERLGAAVGYSIRLESKSSAATCLLFCTTGILTRRLKDDPDLEGVTHVFVDEVHERSMESDFLLMVLRDLLRRRPSLRLCLMSATLDASLFSDYFARGGKPVPTVKMPGRAFPVAALYLEDAIELVGHAVQPGADWAKRGGGGKGGGGKGGGGKGGDGKGGGGGNGSAEMRPGDWLCPGCGAAVFASKPACFRCGAAKPAAGAGGRGAGGRGAGGGGRGAADRGGSGRGRGAAGGGRVAGAGAAEARADDELSVEELAERYPASGETAHRALAALNTEASWAELGERRSSAAALTDILDGSVGDQRRAGDAAGAVARRVRRARAAHAVGSPEARVGAAADTVQARAELCRRRASAAAASASAARKSRRQGRRRQGRRRQGRRRQERRRRRRRRRR